MAQNSSNHHNYGKKESRKQRRRNFDNEVKKTLNRRNSTKNQRRDEEIDGTAGRMAQSPSNPYSWYANFPHYASDVANLAFGTPVGQPIRVFNQDFVAAAGIMTLHYTPTIGWSDGLTSPINRQAVRFQTYLRSVQRAAASYDAADTIMYLMAIDSLYAYWAYLRRAYGVAQLFTPTNKYLPRRLLQAMGIDPSICENLADFRAYINRFALNIGRFAMPKGFDITDRHMWMNTGIYLDSSTTRAQIYLFMPAVFYKYDNTVTTGSKLQGQQFASFEAMPVLRDLHSLVTFGESLLAAIDNDDDTMNISGDLYRAYGPGGLRQVEETPANYAIAPVYDQTVLSQIENATLVGSWKSEQMDSLEMPSITQDPSINSGAVRFTGWVLTYATANANYTKRYGNVATHYPTHFMNMHMDSPTPEAVMEATRLLASTYNSAPIISNGNSRQVVAPCGSEVINYVTICTTSPDNPAAVKFLFYNTNTVWLSEDGAPVSANAFELLALVQQFDWCPMLYIAKAKADATADVLQVAADVDNFTAITEAQLNNIHEAALLSLLDIAPPEVGAIR